MKISLKSIEKLTPVNIPHKDLEEVLSAQVVNVEGIESIASKYAGIAVGQIEGKADHPDSDKMAVYQVNVGTKTVQVVASDKLLQVGDKCPYLPPETKVPYNAHPEKFDGVIKAMTLRGVMSEGMLATSKELEFSIDHSKVLVLNTDAKAGTLLSEVYGLDDLIIDAENKGLTNRPETFGLIGFAREVAGIQGLQFVTPKWFSYQNNEYKDLYKSLITELDAYKAGTEKTRAGFSVNHQADRLSPRYTLIALDNVEVKESPVWLQVELMKAGVRSINNVVDITNYIMILTGQPMHAMDFDKCHPDAEGKINIVVRKAKKGERLTVIDGKSLILDDEMVVICDDSGPQDLAGIMGGMSSEITKDTKRILLECANFDMYNIRKTSNKTGIKSDAVTRFARSQDPNMCEAVMFKALEMLKELSGAKIASQLVDIVAYPRTQRKVSISIARLNAHIGINFDAKKIAQILKNVELETELDKSDPDIMQVLVPTYRQDLNIREDIHEEVARLYGFNNIKQTLPQRTISPTPLNQYIMLTTQIRNSLISMGAYDLLTYNFVGESIFKKAGQDVADSYHIINALSPELEYMRVSLTPSLLEKVSMNHSNGVEELALSEINMAHLKDVLDGENLPYEWKLNALVFSAIDKIAKNKYEGSAYYMAKLYLDGLLKDLKSKEVRYEALTEISHHNELPIWLKNLLPLYDPKLTAIVTFELQNKRYYLGIIGEFCSSVKKAFNLPAYSAGYEINVESLNLIVKSVNSYIEPSKYPAIVEDFCFVADKDVPYKAVEMAISSEIAKETNILSTVEPVDIYMVDKADITKQITIRLTVQSKIAVLDDKYMSKLRERICGSVFETTKAKLKD